MKILVVDDEKVPNDRAKDIWQRLFTNAVITTAFSFDEAKQKLTTEIFDIVSLDAVLDGSNGSEAYTATAGYGWHLVPFIQGEPQIWFVSSLYALGKIKVPGSFGISKVIFWGQHGKDEAANALAPLNKLGADFSIYN